MSDQADDFAVSTRAAGPADTAYLASTWLRGFIEHGAFYEVHRPVVNALLARCDVRVAHPEGDPDTILGFLVHEGADVAHWLYVRAAWRGNGIARALAQAAGFDMARGLVFTHWCPTAAALVRRFKTLAYYPYLVRGA